MKKRKFILLALWCALSLCACTKRGPTSDVYNPSQNPLTANELASLLDLYHWKITQAPDDGKPFTYVRIVVANRGAATVGDNPPYHLIYPTAAVPLNTPVNAKSPPNILIGMQISAERITGQINVISSEYTDTFRIQIPHSSYDQGKSDGNRICSGTSLKDNRVDLIEFLDSNSQITSVVCLEFLHSVPTS